VSAVAHLACTLYVVRVIYPGGWIRIAVLRVVYDWFEFPRRLMAETFLACFSAAVMLTLCMAAPAASLSKLTVTAGGCVHCCCCCCCRTDPATGETVHGLCSNYLCDCKPGDELVMTGPAGTAPLLNDNPWNKPIVCVSTGALAL
jgi:hypothetical protein